MPLCVLLLKSVIAWHGNTLPVPLALLSASPPVRLLCEELAEPPLEISAGTWTVQCKGGGGPRVITHNGSVKNSGVIAGDALSSVVWWCNRPTANGTLPGLRAIPLCLNLNAVRFASEELLQRALAFRPLVQLSLRRVPIKDVNALGKLPSLQVLDLVEAGVLDCGIVGLGESNSLVSINLWGCSGITDVGALGSVLTLEELVVAETHVTNGGIAGLKCSVNLRVLNMEACTAVTCVGALSRLPSLQCLLLVTTGVTHTGIATLGKSQSLVEIDLWGCRGVTCVNSLWRIPTLRRLDLFGTSVTNDGIVELGRCRSLEEIDLTCCKAISDVSCLEGVRTLRRLVLLHTNVEKEACKGFCERVKIII